jgi:TolB protein
MTLALCLLVTQPHVACCLGHALLGAPPQSQERAMADWPNHRDHAADPKETNLRNVRQITFGGQNAEAYWDRTGTKIVWQSRQADYPDEQVFVMNSDGSGRKLVSTGNGRCTCSYFSPDGRWIYFSSTHDRNPGAQKPIDMSKGYVWMVNPEFSIYRRELRTDKLELVLAKNGYLAETTIAPSGRYMTFTGNFEGDLEVYKSDLNGRRIEKLTDEKGYDWGPFVSWDSKQIVFRRAPIRDSEHEKEYDALLAEHLVRPGKLDIWIMDADGKNKRQVTDLGGASFAPFLLPDSKRIVFSSNHHDPKGREFDLFVVNVDGTGLKQVTFTPDFDGFPMVSRDGKRLVWASNRHGTVRGETNVFVADWAD